MNAASGGRTTLRLPAPFARAVALVLALCFGVAGLGAYAATAVGQAGSSHPTSIQAADQPCANDAQDVAAEEPFARTELFFGTAKPDGTAVTAREWSEFLDREITSRFPDGLTVMTGSGQWRDAGGEIVEERSRLVILLYPRDAASESSEKIEQIRTAYEQAFDQESVLRSSDSLPVCVSF